MGHRRMSLWGAGDTYQLEMGMQRMRVGVHPCMAHALKKTVRHVNWCTALISAWPGKQLMCTAHGIHEGMQTAWGCTQCLSAWQHGRGVRESQENMDALFEA